MSKDEVVTFLKKKGYNAKNASGIVYIYYPKEVTDYEMYIEKVKNDIRESGFAGSWGCKYLKEELSSHNETVEITAEE